LNGFVVVDASLAFKWLVPEEHSDKAISLARFWDNEGTQPVAPHLMPVEVANALHRRVVRSELTMEEATRLMECLMATGIELREMHYLHSRALELASLLGQNAVYDAHYLALAETLECNLWTSDERFFRAVGPSARNVRWVGEFDSRSAPA
jgi:predicted nucleic acid-binding protein